MAAIAGPFLAAGAPDVAMARSSPVVTSSRHPPMAPDGPCKSRPPNTMASLSNAAACG